MKLGRITGAIGRGLVAGAAGTAAMTVSSTIEMKLRGREASSVPADAVEEVLDVEPKDEEAKERLGNLAHFGYGTGWGAARGLLGITPLPHPAATAAHFGLVWGAGLTMLPVLKLAPPPQKWGAKELAVDALHHAVYAVATGLAFFGLTRNGRG